MNAALFLKKINNKLFNADEKHYRREFLKNRVTEAELSVQRTVAFPCRPKISILVPVYKTPVPFLNDMVKSVLVQSYENWELILANASPEEAELSAALKEWKEKDPRIVVFDLAENGGISENTNRAYEKAAGDFIALFDHDDMLEADALYCYMDELYRHPDAEVFYCDEDKITEDSNRFFFPNVKPGLQPDTLYSNNYICHFLMVKRETLEKVGGWRKEFDGAQDFDLVLRLSRVTKRFVHVPRILYHWRSHSASTAKSQDTKSYAATAGARAVKDHFDALGINVTTEPGVHAGWVRVRYPEIPETEIAEITYDESACAEAFRNIRTRLSDETKPYVILREMSAPVLTLAEKSDLCGPLLRTEVGVAAPRILDSKGNVYRNGYDISDEGIPELKFFGYPSNEPGEMCKNLTTRNVYSVSGEIMAFRREVLADVFNEIGKVFDEKALSLPAESLGLLFSEALRKRNLFSVQRPEVTVKQS